MVGCSSGRDFVQPPTKFDRSLDLGRLGLPDTVLAHEFIEGRPVDPRQALKSCSSRCPTCTAFSPDTPTRSRIASSSALLELVGPEFSQPLARPFGCFQVADAVGGRGLFSAMAGSSVQGFSPF